MSQVPMTILLTTAGRRKLSVQKYRVTPSQAKKWASPAGTPDKNKYLAGKELQANRTFNT